MGSCPKCKSSVAVNDVNCPKCGALLAGIPEESGTLNANQHFQFSEEVAPTPLAAKESTTPGGGAHVGDSSDTLGADDLSKALPEKEGSSGRLASEDSHQSDSSKTIRLPANSLEADSEEEVSSTQNFTDSDLRSAMGKGDSGTDGQLNRVWDAAIGSSGKDSKQSLRFERAEASDSVFRRVAVRLIADANATQTEGADYQIQDKLGEGGMGMVYSALQTAVNRVVAIKTIKAEKFEDIGARKQFFYEAEVTAELDHPNIPAIYELGRTEDGTLFYAMKLIRGIEWQKLLRKKTREENLEIFGKIADAVAFAHSKNVIHRDLKPDNVMLGTFGEVYLSDWGLAVNQSKKKDIDFGGTPEFMAPEMARNQRDQIGKHSDIYLLGAILYQIVTGTPPHMGRTQRDRLRAATKNEITPTDKVDPLLNIARRAMETEPSLRHATVAEFQDEIRAVNTHAESIALANRSSDVAASAAQLQDYDRFTRAIFGFRDAIDMWADNKTAKVGLENARFAYGQCAFDKGDYDLALQTLDRSVPREADVYEKATKAKLLLEQRESRFKTLTRAFVAAVSFLLLVATGTAFYANNERISAVGARGKAEAAAEEERKAKETAINEKLAADKAKEQEEIARMAADDATKLANKEKMAADMARKTAESEKMIAQMARTDADKAKEAAVKAKGEAETAAEQEKAARKISQTLAVKNRIGGSVEQLGRANSSTSQFDNKGAKIVLERTKEFTGQEFMQKTKDVDSAIENVPKFDTFAWKRVNLLTNSDLPNLPNKSKVMAMDFAPAVKLGIVGTQDGQLEVYRYDADGLNNVDTKHRFPGSTIECVAISPSGDEAFFSKTTGTSSSTFVWSLVGKSEPVEASVLGAKSFQSMRYSPDGKRIVLGISGGVRVLTRGENWKSKDIKAIKEIDLQKNIRGVRGDLLDLQWVDGNTVLASVKTEKNVSLFVLNVDNLTSTRISLPESIADSLSAATMLGSGKRLLFASGDGKLSVGDIKVGKVKEEIVLSVENFLALDDKHRAAISRLVVNADDRILSISDKEPVVHVWKAKAGGEVIYDTYLTGVPGSKASTPNIINALFATDDAILGLDDYGTSIAWSIERQKQRRQLMVEEHPASVVGSYGRGSTPQAISVTEDGVVDIWNLQTGKTDKSIPRFSYFGHTPGSVFVDSAVDLKSGVIVTSASLDKAERRYLQDDSHNWEFCVWDQSTGNMIKRWSIAAPSNFNNEKESKNSTGPRMTMLNNGKEILIANYSQTLIYTVMGETVPLKAKSKDIATYFAVPNPKNPSLIAMVNPSSSVWLWDRSDADSWWTSDPNNPILRSREDEGVPLKGVWNEDGNRFFLVFSSGFVKVYDKGNFRRPSLTSAGDDKAKSVLKIGEHHDIDLVVVPIGDGVDRLVVNVRLPENDPTLATSVAFSLDAKPDRLDESKKESKRGLRWIDTESSGSPKLSSRVHPGFQLNPNSTDSVMASQKQGTHTFVATKAGTIYDIADDLTALPRVGIQKLVSSTSDRQGSVVMQLRQDGSILRLDLPAEGESKWSKAEFSAVGFNKIQLSPNKAQLAILSTDAHLLRIVNAVSGALVNEYKDVAASTWDPSADSVLAIIHTDGKVEMTGLNEPIVLRNVDVKDGRKVKSVHFFNEAWVVEEPTRHLLVQSEKDGEEMSGRIEFVALKPKRDDNGEISDMVESNFLDEKIGLTIATSPVDSLFVTGDAAGTVTVWFASPTWDKPGKIFNLEGHRGARIESIAFGEDGQTLITSDANKRLYGWMTRDFAKPKN